MRLPSAVILFLFISATGFSATIYVPDNCATIQDAINAVSHGDTIIVRPGKYVENIAFLRKNITLRSEKGPEVTVIDGNRTGTVIGLSGDDAVLDGFTIVNGKTCRPGAENGGGVDISGRQPIVRNNIITHNQAELCGGGIYGYDCTYPVIEKNTIVYNEAEYGGGIFIYPGSPRICSNIIAFNLAEEGGGLYIMLNSASLDNITVYGNMASRQGGGIMVDGTSKYVTTIANSIVWGNSAPKQGNLGNLYDPYGYEVFYSDVEGGWQYPFSPGSGFIQADPLFVDDVEGDFHLTANSPCRNTGCNKYAQSGMTEDFEGDPRFAYGTIDMGADEFYYHLYSIGDVIPGSLIDIKVVGVPGLPALLALGTGIQDPPQATPHGDLWLKLPLAKSWQLGSIPSTGILTHTATVPSGWPSGSQHPFQALVGPWGGSSSRLTNLMLVTAE